MIGFYCCCLSGLAPPCDAAALFVTLVERLLLWFAMALSNIEFVDIAGGFGCPSRNPTVRKALRKGYTVRVTISNGRSLDEEVRCEACSSCRKCHRFVQLEWLCIKVLPAHPVHMENIQEAALLLEHGPRLPCLLPLCLGRFERP